MADRDLGPSQDAPGTRSAFETNIALALAGYNWQDLQTPHSHATVMNPYHDRVEESNAEPTDEADDPSTAPVWTAKQKQKKKRLDKALAEHAGDVLDTIAADSVAVVADQVSWNGDPELLCCYNWQSSTDGTNTIFVPGAPPKWQPPELPYTLPVDTEIQFTDYNYARQPKHPYDPMFQALAVMNPDYQFMDVDVLADRNNLRVLLEFVQGKSNGPFRLDLYTIYNTLVIVRNESKWWNVQNGVSRGSNFEKAFTRPEQGMEDSTSHYRVIRYPLGPLSVVCRFEADAYDDGTLPDEMTASEVQAVAGGPKGRPTFTYNAPIRVLQKGRVVPTGQIIELKTKAMKKDANGYNVSTSVQCQDQLWFGRTSALCTALYQSGTGEIDRIKFENAIERVLGWEAKNQESLRKLVGLLVQLKAVMKRERRPNHSVIIVREDKGGPLTIRTMESFHRVIRQSAFAQHWRRQGANPGYVQRGGYPRNRGHQQAARGRGGYRGGEGTHQNVPDGHSSQAPHRHHGTPHGRGRGSHRSSSYQRRDGPFS